MIIAIIPAKGFSRRLTGKNMFLVNNHPLLFYTIEYAKKSKLIDKIYVSTDDIEIEKYALKENVDVIKRPESLGGETLILEVYKHAFHSLKFKNNIEAIVGLQCDHPDRNLPVDDTITFFRNNKLDALYSEDKNGKKNGAHFIIAKNILLGEKIIKKKIIIDDCTNIHFKDDIQKIETKLKNYEV
jgi:CMP-N,N'-diacetyllegionaminic acid synthase